MTETCWVQASGKVLYLFIDLTVGGVQMRYRYRIEPIPVQQRMLARVFGCARVVFGDALLVREELPLKVRQWTCPACQVVHDRDHNAAKVILAAGRAERQNACGARVSPQLIADVGAEAGSNPTAA